MRSRCSVWPRLLRGFLASFRRRLGPLYGVQVPRVLMIGARCLPCCILCDVLRPFRTCCGYLFGLRLSRLLRRSVSRFLASLPTVCRFKTCRGRVYGLLSGLIYAVVLSAIQAVKCFCGPSAVRARRLVSFGPCLPSCFSGVGASCSS